MVQRQELLKSASKVDFLINLSNINLPGQIPSKLIDYAIANRPILELTPNNIDKRALIEFLEGNYNKRYRFKNISEYHISKVVNKFINLVN